MKNQPLITASACALLAPAAWAQEIFDLGEIIVSAGEVPVAEDRTGVTVEVLDEEAINEAPDTRVLESLDRLPGVSVASTGTIGTVGSVFIRGLPARYVGFRLNGIDISDPSSVQVQADPGSLTSAGLGRIEVLKGSQSGVYGSEAIGGVVDIRTARLEEDGQEIRFGAEYGSFNTRRADISFLQKSGDFDISFTLSYVKTDGFSAADENDGNTEDDGFQGITGLLSFSYGFAPDWRAGVDVIYQNEEFNIDGNDPVTFAFGDQDRPNTSDRVGARAFVVYETEQSAHELSYSYFEIDRRDPFGFSPLFLSDRRELKYDGRITRGATTFVFGGDYTEETATLSNGTFSTETTSIFGEIQYAVNDTLDVSAALRFDDHDQFGSATTGRLAAAWRPTDRLVLKASLGTGFRAPSLNELFGPFGANPDLQPEESRSIEFSSGYTFASGAAVEATVFYTEIDDLIDFVSDPVTFVGQYVQVPGTTRTRGLELSGSAPLSDAVDLFGSYTFTDATNRDGTPSRRVPRHQLVVGLDAELTDKLSGQIVANHVAERVEGFFAPVDVENFTVVDMQVTYDITDRAEAYLRVENLFDEEYQRVPGFGTSDRAFYVGVRASF